jgi:hypothetical protein
MLLFVQAANVVAELYGSNERFGLGKEELRDPEAPCHVFFYGKPEGDCQTDGHFLCTECKNRDPNTIKDPDSPWYVPPMERRQHKAEW